MNKNPSRKNGTRRTGGFTPGKIVVVAVLAVILIVVVVVQLPTQPTATVAAPRNRPDDKSAARRTPPERVVRRRPVRQPVQESRQTDSRQATAAKEQAGLQASVVHVANWPVRMLDDTDGINPFQLPAPLRSLEQERLAAETEQQRIERLERERMAEQQAESQRKEQARLAELQRQRERQAEKERLAELQRIEQERKRVQNVIDELRKKGVAIVLSDRNGRIARIGDRTIRVGDQFDGVEVTEIKENGSVLVRPVDPAIAKETNW